MPDGSKIVSESDDNTIQILDASTGIDVLSLLQYHDKDISSVAFSPDGSKILSKFDNGAIQVWNVSTEEVCAGEGLNNIKSQLQVRR